MKKGVSNPDYIRIMLFRATVNMDEETRFHAYCTNKVVSEYIREAVQAKNKENEVLPETPELRERAKDFVTLLYKRNKLKEMNQRK